MDDYRKPRWWKRSIRSYWLILVILPFVSILVVLGALFLQGVMALTELLKYAVVTSVMIGTAYYIRKINSLKVWRAIWILLGATVIGLLILVPLKILLVDTLGAVIGWLPSFLLCYGIAVLVGALLGDYIGKRRDYRPLV